MAITSTQVDTAITAVLEGAQSYRLPDGTMVTRASLAELRALRDKLKAEEAAAAGDDAICQPLAFGDPS